MPTKKKNMCPNEPALFFAHLFYQTDFLASLLHRYWVNEVIAEETEQDALWTFVSSQQLFNAPWRRLSQSDVFVLLLKTRLMVLRIKINSIKATDDEYVWTFVLFFLLTLYSYYSNILFQCFSSLFHSPEMSLTSSRYCFIVCSCFKMLNVFLQTTFRRWDH